MKNIRFPGKSTKYWFFLLLVLGIQTIFAWQAVNSSRGKHILELKNNAAETIDFLHKIIRERLQNRDYVSAALFLQEWGKSHSNRVLGITLMTNNGFTLSQYSSNVHKDHIFSLTESIPYSYRGAAKLHMVFDLSSAYAHGSDIAKILSIAIIIFTLILALLLLLYVRQKNFSFSLQQQSEDLHQTINQLKHEINLRQQSERKLSSLLQAAPTGIGVMIDRIFKEVNQRFCDLVGYSEDELLGENARMVYNSDEEYEKIGRVQMELVNKKQVGNMESCLRHKNGNIIKVINSWTLMDSADESAGIIFNALDISDLKNSEIKLRQSENKFRSMMESMSDLVYICSQNRRVEYMNPAMIERTGRDATGEFCYKALHDLEGPCPWCSVNSKNHGSYFETNVVSPKDDHSYHVSHSPIIHDDGSVSRMVVLRDTTEFKKLEEQLLQAQKMESIGTLAGGVAHDFNNILTVISGYAQISLVNFEENSRPWKRIKEIEKAVDRASNLTRQLLAFSRKQVITPKPVDINTLIPDMKKMLGRLIGEDIQLETLLDQNVDLILADQVQLEQLILNLTVNARDAIRAQPEGTEKTIKIATSQIYLDEEYAAIHEGITPGWYLQLQVEDSGCGMTEEVRSHIFEPFYTTKGVGKGTGMGLATVYGIVKQNKGIIHIDSEPGQGSSFKVYWPMMAEEIESVEDAGAGKLSVGGSETILLAEDDEQLREVTSLQLREAGYKVIEASDGQEAMGKAQNYHGNIDLLFTDVVMPVMGGKTLSENIKDIYPDIHTLFASGYMDDTIHQVIARLEESSFINKPYTISDVLVRIRQLLDKPEG